jgi:hypothetical protein
MYMPDECMHAYQGAYTMYCDDKQSMSPHYSHICICVYTYMHTRPAKPKPKTQGRVQIKEIKTLAIKEIKNPCLQMIYDWIKQGGKELQGQ